MADINVVIDVMERLKEEILFRKKMQFCEEIETEFNIIFTEKINSCFFETDNTGLNAPAPPEVFTAKFASDLGSEADGELFTIKWYGEGIYFIEFGTGVAQNGSSVTFGNITVEMGSYGKHQGLNDKWSFIGNDGRVYWTHGTYAQHPFYDSIQELVRRLPEIARRVYSK